MGSQPPGPTALQKQVLLLIVAKVEMCGVGRPFEVHPQVIETATPRMCRCCILEVVKPFFFCILTGPGSLGFFFYRIITHFYTYIKGKSG